MTDEQIEKKIKKLIEEVITEAIMGGYQVGLKAGSPKWHKVADGDLPKNENDVLIYSGEEWRMCVGRYSPKNKAWEAGCDTVAWCEIPEYKGKE
jgi:hypothetical protein